MLVQGLLVARTGSVDAEFDHFAALPCRETVEDWKLSTHTYSIQTPERAHQKRLCSSHLLLQKLQGRCEMDHIQKIKLLVTPHCRFCFIALYLYRESVKALY